MIGPVKWWLGGLAAWCIRASFAAAATGHQARSHNRHSQAAYLLERAASALQTHVPSAAGLPYYYSTRHVSDACAATSTLPVPQANELRTAVAFASVRRLP